MDNIEIEKLGLLKKLSPAETHYLIDGEYASYKRLFQLTVMDLHFKQVLCVKTRTDLDAPYGRNREMIYVSLGKRFRGHEAKEHEKPFIEVFKQETDIEYLLISYVKVVKEYIGKESKFIKNMLLKSVDLKPLLRSASWRDFFLSRKLTKRGLAEQALQKQNLRLLNKHLPALIEKQPAKSREILDTIRGNVFLLDNVDHKLLKLLSMGHLDGNEGAYAKKEGSIGYDGTHDSRGAFAFSDHDFDLYIDADNGIFDTGFDSGFDTSDGGSGSSGCGSGCSSCGGCGD